MRHTWKSTGGGVSNSPIEIGDMLFLFKYADFPSGFSLKDRVEDASGEVLSIKHISAVLDLAIIVTVAGNLS